MLKDLKTSAMKRCSSAKLTLLSFSSLILCLSPPSTKKNPTLLSLNYLALAHTVHSHRLPTNNRGSNKDTALSRRSDSKCLTALCQSASTLDVQHKEKFNGAREIGGWITCRISEKPLLPLSLDDKNKGRKKQKKKQPV